MPSRSRWSWTALRPAMAAYGLALTVGRGRTRDRAPVVEDLRDVHDPAGDLGDPQHEVVVLRTVVAFAEAADLRGQPRCASRTGGRCTSGRAAARATSRACGTRRSGCRRRRPCPRRSRGSRRRGSPRSRTSDRATSASGTSRSSWSSRTMNSPVRRRDAVVGRRHDVAVLRALDDLDACVAGGEPAQQLADRRVGEQSSTRISSQSSKSCSSTELMVSSRTSNGGS